MRIVKAWYDGLIDGFCFLRDNPLLVTAFCLIALLAGSIRG